MAKGIKNESPGASFIIAVYKKTKPADRLLIFQITFCILMVVFRILKSDEPKYTFLLWNLFLASIPLLFSRMSTNKRIVEKSRILVYPILFLWLIFLPNSPYLITDFVHLEESNGIPLWFDILLLTYFSLTGLIIATLSVSETEKTIATMHSAIAGRWFAFSSLILSSLGVYIGRILRYNSWDVFICPIRIILEVSKRLLNPNDNQSLYGMIIGLSVLSIVFYSFYKKAGPAIPGKIQ
jgi:uncharacterized membrane protein